MFQWDYFLTKENRMKIFRYSTHGYLLTLVLSFCQEGHGKLAP